MSCSNKEYFFLNGKNLTPDLLSKLSRKEFFIDLDDETWDKVRHSSQVVENIVKKHEKVYGITTGFGFFSDVLISDQQILELQKNIIRSHSCGLGSPIGIDLVRVILVLRINVLAKGHSGLSETTLRKFIQAYNLDLLPLIYDQGTVGASGDLAPLSHLCLGLIGEGKLYDFDTHTYVDAEIIMKKHNFEKIYLGPKEGLSLINGTQFLTAFLNKAFLRARKLAFVSEVIFSLTIEALNGALDPFHPKLFILKQNSKEKEVAGRILSYILNSNNEISNLRKSLQESFTPVEPYSMICFPQAQGQILQIMDMINEIITNEINAVTDNPLVFTKKDDDPSLPKDYAIISGGNFHGEYIAKAADYLAVAAHDIALISERRIERLVNPYLSNELPAFLAEFGGLNSGFMIVQYTAASLVSENKHLSAPASVDTIPTSAEQEDHVSMGGWSVRKALKIVENAERVLAIELMCNCQALDLRKCETSTYLEDFKKKVREKVPYLKVDAPMTDYIEALTSLIQNIPF